MEKGLSIVLLGTLRQLMVCFILELKLGKIKQAEEISKLILETIDLMDPEYQERDYIKSLKSSIIDLFEKKDEKSINICMN